MPIIRNITNNTWAKSWHTPAFIFHISSTLVSTLVIPFLYSKLSYTWDDNNLLTSRGVAESLIKEEASAMISE